MKQVGLIDIMCPWPWRGRLIDLIAKVGRLQLENRLLRDQLEEVNGVMRAVSMTLAKTADKNV